MGTVVAAALIFGCAGIAATSVPLVGNQAVEARADSDAAGLAEAFQTTAAASGTAADLMVYVDTAPPTTVTAGLYADAAGHPGALLAQGTLAAPKAATWNDVALTTAPSLSAGTKYWIAILSPPGAGTVHFRDRKSSGLSETSSATGLSALPAAWSTGTRYTDAFLSAYVLAGAADTTPPSQPQGFAVTASTATSISTSWSASTDDVGVTGYSLYVGAQEVGTTASPAYTFAGLTCGQSYTLGVAASDAAGNLSARTTLTAPTPACPDTTPPSAPSSLTVTTSTPSTISLLWAAATDNVAVAGYDVSLDGQFVTTVSGTSYTFGGLTCDTFHTLAVDAYDAAGNTSSVASLAASSGSCPDTTPPTVAFTAPAAGSSIAGTVTVAANAADAGGVSSVRFTLDGVSLRAVDTTAPYQVTWDTTMFVDGTHTLTAVATDAAGNSATAAESVTVANAAPAITVEKIYEGADSDRIVHTFSITSAVPVGHTLLLTHASTVDATDGSGGIVVPGGVSDPGGNAWRQVAVSHPGLSFTTVEAWTAPVTTALAAGASISVRGYSRGLSDEIAIFDVTGLAADPGDLQAGYAGYIKSPATPYITPTQAHVLLVAVHGQSSAGAPWWTPEDSTPAWTKYVDRFDSSNGRGIAVDMREVTARVAYRTAGTISSTATSNNLIVALRAGR